MRKIISANLIGIYILLTGQAVASDPTAVVLEPDHFQTKFRVTMKSGGVKELDCDEKVPSNDEIAQFLKTNSEVEQATKGLF